MDSVQERLTAFIKHLGISKNKFAETIGTSSALVSKLTTQDVDFRVDILTKILAKYPELNIQWLLTGVGEMTHNYSKEEGVLINSLLHDGKMKDLQAINLYRFNEKEEQLRYNESPEQTERKRALLSSVNKMKRIAKGALQREKPELVDYMSELDELGDLVFSLEKVYMNQFDIYNEEDIPWDIELGIASLPDSSKYKAVLDDKISRLLPYRNEITEIRNSINNLLLKIEVQK